MVRLITAAVLSMALVSPTTANFLSSSRLWEWCKQGMSLGYNLGAHDGFEFSQAINGRAALCTDGMTAADFDRMVCSYLEDFPSVRDNGPALEVVVAASIMTGPACSR